MSDPLSTPFRPPDPAQQTTLVGHAAAEQAVLEAWRYRRMPQAWLLHGPAGIGKATLAWRVARCVLAGGEGADLSVPPDHPVARRVAAGAHGDVRGLQRQVNERTGRLRPEILVDDVRAVSQFLTLTPAAGGWRVVIVDAADHLNRNAANALLKVLEEPPPNVVLLLVSHAPGRLLPTLRSRCRALGLTPLNAEDMGTVVAEVAGPLMPDDPAAARRLMGLAEGSPGTAVALLQHQGLDLQARLWALLDAGTRSGDRHQMLHELAETVSSQEGQWHLLPGLLSGMVVRLVRCRACESDAAAVDAAEAAVFQGVGGSLDQWVEVWEKVSTMLARSDALALDRRQTVFGAMTDLLRTAGIPV